MRGYEQPTLFGDEPTKRCNACGALKSLTEFHRNRWANDGLQGRCKPCNIARAMRYHAENLEHCRERIGRWVKRINHENKDRVLDFLSTHPCIECGEDDPVVLEFDHRGDKRSGIAELLQGHVRWEVIEAEIAKCDVRCANCHRRRTAIAGSWFRAVATVAQEATSYRDATAGV